MREQKLRTSGLID